MKHIWIRAGAAAMALAMLLTTLCGCASASAKNNSAPTAVALVLGCHANSRDLNLNSPLIKEEVTQAIVSFGFVSVIANDGAPGLVSADNYQVPEQYRGNAQLLRTMAEKSAASLLSGLSQVRADDAEVDTLEALRLAVRTLASAPEGAQREIVVVDTGLSTSGILNFGNNILSAPAATVADLLAEKEAIPDFTGITVEWQQMGDVSAPQQTLSAAQVRQLTDIWQAIVEKGGGTFISSLTVANPGSESGDLPPVSTVDLPATEPVAFDPNAMGDFDTPQFLSEEQVRFVSDSDIYLEPDRADAVIAPVAAYMKENPAFTMLLIGTTAGDGSSAESLALSARRALAVKNTLVSLGVPGERILTLGLGSADPWHIAQAGEDDGLITHAAIMGYNDTFVKVSE